MGKAKDPLNLVCLQISEAQGVVVAGTIDPVETVYPLLFMSVEFVGSSCSEDLNAI